MSWCRGVFAKYRFLGGHLIRIRSAAAMAKGFGLVACWRAGRSFWLIFQEEYRECTQIS